MSRFLVRCLAGFLLLWSMVPVAVMALPLTSATTPNPAPNAVALLTDMMNASHRLDYAGRFVYSHDHHLSSLSILHENGKQGEQARLTHLDGRPAEILHQSGSLLYIRPDLSVTRLASHGSLIPFALSVHFAGILPTSYHLSLDGSDRVAGRATWRLSLTPKDDLRYGYRLWLDQASHLLLKSQVVDPDGEVLEQLEFVSLVLDPAYSPKAFALPQGAHEPVNAKTQQGAAALDVKPVASWLPAGFKPVATEARPLRWHDQQPFDSAVTYSDGLATFTLFVTSAVKPTSREARMGSTWAMSRQVEGAVCDCKVTLVGELPEATASRILAALVLEPVSLHPAH